MTEVTQTRRQRSLIRADISSEGLPDDEVLVRMSTPVRGRDGHILHPDGCQLANFIANPVFLWSHDVDQPVGMAPEVRTDASGVVARVKFAPAGVSAKADEVRGLVKAGIIRGVSVGFDILEAEPIDPARPRAGLNITQWELLECSFCSIPVDTGATVTARAESADEWKVGAGTGLPIEDSDDWDGPAAQAGIFEHAGGDDFDPAVARKGFLVYNAAKPKLRGSYKLPIAHVVDGKMTVPKGAIRAAASRLPDTDIPEATKTAAQKVLDAYKKKAGIGDDDDGGRAAGVPHRRKLLRAGAAVRGLGQVGQLAWMLDNLGYLHSSSCWEEETEEDTESVVPAMLGEALVQLGNTLLAMTKEEVTEMLTGRDLVDEDEIDGLPAEDRAYVRAVAGRRQRAFRMAFVRARAAGRRAGKVLSAENQAKLERAVGHIDKARGHMETAAEHHADTAEAHETAVEHHARAATAHDKLTAALDRCVAEPGVPDHMAAAQRACRSVGRNLDAVSASHDTMKLSHEDVADSMKSAGRCMRSAQRAAQAVVDGADADPAALDADSKTIQTSAGTDVSTGSDGGRALTLADRQRRLKAFEYADAAD